MDHFRRSKLRLLEFNVENLFIRLDHYQGEDLSQIGEKAWQNFSSSTIPNKPIATLRQIAAVILEIDPDLIMLVEVGGSESLQHFNLHFLGNRYQPLILEGNSNRGIDLGYLLRRSLPFTYDLHSHKERQLDFLYPHERLSRSTGYGHLRSARAESHKFSRDVLELQIFDGEGDPACIALLAHLKSPLDRFRIDPGGRDRRKAELDKLVEIYLEISTQHPATPVLLSGDFNGFAGRPQTESEFLSLYEKTTLVDALETAGVPREDRFSFQQIYRGREPMDRQIDFIFLPPELTARVNPAETWSYRYRDEKGHTRQIPRTLEEKKLQPSDHFPVVLTLDPRP